MAHRNVTPFDWGRYTASRQRALLGAGLLLVGFLLLMVDVFIPSRALQTAAIGLTGLAFIAFWSGIVRWRMPVLPVRTLWLFTALWCVGLATSVVLVLVAAHAPQSLVWSLAVHGLAFTLSLFVGALLFRALFYRRATPIVGRLLSLLSPMAILILSLIAALVR